MNYWNSTIRIKVKEAKSIKPPRLSRRAALRAGGKLRSNGRKTQDWIKVRRELSVEFAAAGITACELKYEGCWGEKALGWAHGRKRRNLKDGELKSLVALVCNPCHGKIEYLPPAEMLAIIQDIIERRETVAA